MEALFVHLLNVSLTAGVVAVAVMLLRLLLKKAPKWITVLLWGLVAVRLLVPVSIESPVSVVPDLPTVGTVSSSDAAAPSVTPSENEQNASTPNGETAAPSPSTPSESEGILSEETNAATGDSKAAITPTQAATVIWLVGAAGMAVYAVISYALLYRRVRTATRLEAHVYQSEAVASPFLLGVFCPRIYVPYGMTEQELSAVLAHERAHIKRGDHIVKPLGFLLLSVYWFQPLLWIAYILLCRDIELACDERVVKTLSADERRVYSAALLSSAVGRSRVAACPLAFGEVAVASRIKSVMHYKKPAFWIVIVAGVLGVAAAVCLLTDPIAAIPSSPYATFEGAELWIRMGDTVEEYNRLSLSAQSEEEPVGHCHIPEKGNVEFRILEKNVETMTVTVGMSRAVYDADGNAITRVQVPCDEVVAVYLLEDQMYGVRLDIHLQSAVTAWTRDDAIPSGEIKRFVNGDVSLYLFPTHFRLASTGDPAMYVDGTVMYRNWNEAQRVDPWPLPPYEENVTEGTYEWREDTLVLTTDGGLARYVFTVGDDGTTLRHDKDRLLRHARSHAPILKDGLKLTCEYVLSCEKQYDGSERSIAYTLTNGKGENTFTGVADESFFGIASYGDGVIRLVAEDPVCLVEQHEDHRELQRLVNLKTGDDLGVCSQTVKSGRGEHYPTVWEQNGAVEVAVQYRSDTRSKANVIISLDGLTSLRNGTVEASVIDDTITVRYTDDDGNAREIVRSIDAEIARLRARTLDVVESVVDEGAMAVFTQEERTVYYADVAQTSLHTGDDDVEIGEALRSGRLTIDELEQVLV